MTVKTFDEEYRKDREDELEAELCPKVLREIGAPDGVIKLKCYRTRGHENPNCYHPYLYLSDENVLAALEADKKRGNVIR